MTLGDARWEQGNGRLSAADRWRYVLAAVGAQIGMFIDTLGPRRYRSSAIERLDIARIEFPDTACAKAATETLERAATPAIAHHSYRSYIWASLLGQLDGRRWDAEVLYVAMMLHDLGPTDTFHGSCSCAQCFTLDGVNAAPHVLASMAPDRAERIRRAVLLHLNVSVPGDVHGWEAHYVRAGTAMDIVGQRYRDLPRRLIDATLDRHPRLNLKDEIVGWAAKESRLRPGSRMATLNRIGFSSFVRAAPYRS